MILDALRPHLRMVGMPLACVVLSGTAWIAASVVTGPAIEHLPARAQLAGHIAVGLGVAAAAGRMVLWTRRAGEQKRLDEEAAETLDLLRLEAMRSGNVLLEIHDVQWTTGSGQRVWAVDALTGAVGDRWLPGPPSPPGSLVLLRQLSGRPADVIARMTPAVLLAATRHRNAEIDRGASARHMVVDAAERLLRE